MPVRLNVPSVHSQVKAISIILRKLWVANGYRYQLQMSILVVCCECSFSRNSGFPIDKWDLLFSISYADVAGYATEEVVNKITALLD